MIAVQGESRITTQLANSETNVLAEGLGERAGAAVPDCLLDVLGSAAFGERAAAGFFGSEARCDLFVGYGSDVARNFVVELRLDLLGVQLITQRRLDLGPHSVSPLMLF
jgi:hypothetical protein